MPSFLWLSVRLRWLVEFFGFWRDQTFLRLEAISFQCFDLSVLQDMFLAYS
jgi:hypothetical protein